MRELDLALSEVCGWCHGHGVIIDIRRSDRPDLNKLFLYREDRFPCPDCGGLGRIELEALVLEKPDTES